MENDPPSSLPSSPPAVSSPPRDAPSSTTSSKPKRPPTVTPRRFNKFFDPRSSRGSSHSITGSSGRELRDITFNAANSRTTAAAGQHDERDEFTSPRLRKRRRQNSKADDENDVFPPGSSPPSSPLQSASIRPSRVQRCESAGWQPFPRAIQKSRDVKRSNLWKYEAADFVSSPKDRRWNSEYGITFCAAACNTNSLFATGNELGRVLILDSDIKTNLQNDAAWLTLKPHVNAVTDLVFSSDDKYLASASGDMSAKVMDMRTQKVVAAFGHTSSLKQIRFQPGNNNLLATCGRNSVISVWDVRCPAGPGPKYFIKSDVIRQDDVPRAGRATLPSGPAPDARLQNPRSKSSSVAEPAKSKASATALEFLQQGREHLFVTASDSSAQLMVWDIRGQHPAGSYDSKPLSVTAAIPSHLANRHHGVNWLSLSSDGGRLYSVCRDSTVYAYSTHHLVLGQAPEFSHPAARARRFHPEYNGLGPLYGFRHAKFRASTFYVRSAVRAASTQHPEVLAAGSSDGNPVIFPTDESLFASQLREGHRSAGKHCSSQSSLKSFDETADGPPIVWHGTALVRGHASEVTSLAWTPRGELVSVGDDYTTRCWREDGAAARDMRTGGEVEGRRHMWGWADMDAEWDDDDG